MADKVQTIHLVDTSGYIFRAYHGIRHLSDSKGNPTNAVFGVTRMLLKLLREEQPDHLAMVMDPGGKNFRHEMYPEYKANRPPAPDDLKYQIPLVQRAIEALNLPVVVHQGFEADDVIASLCHKARAAGFGVVVVSADKDLMQLVGEGVVMWDPNKDTRYDPAGVRKKMAVGPDQVLDLLALMGDSSDNIPGVQGIGPKKAATLLAQHGHLESVLAAAPEMKKSKMRERLIEQADQARLSYRLAALSLDVPVEFEPERFARKEPDPETLDSFLAEMEFSGLRGELTPRKTIDTAAYRTIRDERALAELLSEIRAQGVCALDLETTSLDPMRAQVVGISLCAIPGQAAYIPVAHSGPDAQEQLDLELVLEQLAPLVADEKIELYGQNIKYDALILAQRHKLQLGPVACDSMLASYVLDPGRSHGLDALSRDLLGHETIAYTQVAGKGKDQIPFAQVAVDQATAYAGEDADVTLRLCQLLMPQVAEAGLLPVLTELELPLAPVLMKMEQAGILVDEQLLKGLSAECQEQLGGLTGSIYELAGREFNINSPAQLRVVLFEDLELPISKKTKSGPSTDVTVLEELAALHPLPAKILEYRSLTKLRSTYLDVLPQMINPDTGRIHSRFNQAVAATGRLSSSDPNLQNIPIRTAMGRRIRQAFVAPEGKILLSADYSQVELRIMAHLCQDEALLEAFDAADDIHARTAARVFEVDVNKVTSDMRSRAKAVNFGIIYGQGPFNLARQLQIPRGEAKEIIDSYLERHKRVGQWVAQTHEQARQDGFVTTLFGRRRFLPDINSSNHNVRSNAERIAQNTPIQGTAADIIKRAMIDVDVALAESSLDARLVLQVHDELMFEVAERDLNLLEELVREKMENAASLRVPLVVDISWGASWAEAH